jgi:hypothetical protein
MAHVKKGQLTAAPQWWKHLRDWKRVFWKAERKAAKQLADSERRTCEERR